MAGGRRVCGPRRNAPVQTSVRSPPFQANRRPTYDDFLFLVSVGLLDAIFFGGFCTAGFFAFATLWRSASIRLITCPGVELGGGVSSSLPVTFASMSFVSFSV